MHLIDTNIFLEVFFDQEKADECQQFLEKTSKGEFNCLVTHFTVHAIEAQLGDKEDKLETVLNALQKSIGLELHNSTLVEEKKATLHMNELTFDDALHYFVAEKEGIDTIVSLDSDFDSTDLERKEPSDLIG